ncbi:hypothetical protein GLAREA_11857 [Glarea lozoyensis ATCC 20868]|uniref:Uncharacterized protein n=1 Tax=Glarea lozoyensis (strain ATCC 20868 / MF5171) TaxID=1116229 RepID=S3D1W8_GLAL2|nr:uncharacterized protein GLAREA_11857 [Glarea lozoyensis ATCC 20868]EPE31775.1 hypothetical protein GLAREA_11857 [Glarea lozoyensis ATCC 20868]
MSMESAGFDGSVSPRTAPVLNTSSHNSHLLTLRMFPTELREIIFKHALLLIPPAPRATHFEYCTVSVQDPAPTPTLLVALRGDAELYHEALRAYYGVNTFTVTNTSYVYRLELKPSTIAYIQHIRVLYYSGMIDKRPDLEAHEGSKLTSSVLWKLVFARSLRTLHFTIFTNERWIILFLRYFLKTPRLLRKLSLHYPKCALLLSETMDTMNSLFTNSKGKLETISSKGDKNLVTASEDWFWEGDNGGVLQLAQKIEE